MFQNPRYTQNKHFKNYIRVIILYSGPVIKHHTINCLKKTWYFHIVIKSNSRFRTKTIGRAKPLHCQTIYYSLLKQFQMKSFSTRELFLYVVGTNKDIIELCIYEIKTLMHSPVQKYKNFWDACCSKIVFLQRKGVLPHLHSRKWIKINYIKYILC